ncbi:MAG: EamA family transporter RarD [Rhodospirillales bacterium]|nr:EamA family transporter RarD [Rhodospirillales bacterium]MDH3909678.1 EamA family transporter RarD [Rhodospirillales bacterium]MDH3920279.1 EamA family transporter RarD [Rhodospirillales bacterium]MDH3965761.1 EamA family transporter RarD [Rhodospirillales bacterium]
MSAGSAGSAGQGDRARTTAGVFYALAAFLFWGGIPVYFKAVGHVPAAEILAHRVVWSVVLLAGLVTLTRHWPVIRTALGDRRTRLLLVLSTLIVSVNWLVFIWAIASGRVLETSLGYYINPLVNVVLGMVVLRERIGPWRGFAVGLATVGVLNLAVRAEGLPWVSLTLALTFGLYGLIRKTVRIEAVDGLFVETALLLPLALAYLGWLAFAGSGAFGAVGLETDLLLFLAGAVTALPLIWFTAAARRLDYSTVGFFQYIAPSCQFLLAVLVYGESFTGAHLITFLCIWSALAIVTARSALEARRRRAVARAAG